MSYSRIQQVLEADSMFAPQVAEKTQEVTTRGGEKLMLPKLVMDVHNALKAAGCSLQSVARTTILATAARLASGDLPPPPPAPPAPATPAPAPAVRKKEAEKPTPKSTSKPVIVTAQRPGAPRPIVVEKQPDTEVIHRYQCAVASAQLLAALHQLFEKDDFPGHEQRKKKLDELINEVEHASSQHVNLSVKAIIHSQSNAR